jgi:protocatechuate 3,4-dioxygenase beta subunit
MSGSARKAPVWSAALLALVLLGAGGCRERSDPPTSCTATPYDELGPFYRPGAPVRDQVGSGYRLSGRVLSLQGCRPLPGTRLEFWLVNPQGEYDEAHRATLFSDRDGFYRFESNRPTDYVGRLPHIHIMVTAVGHQQLITQHYPGPGQATGEFDLVLEPSP